METNRAGRLMTEGHVCAESVLLAVCQELDIEIDEKLIPRVAFGFAGGIGNTGSVCGAVAGAVMAIALARERGETMEDFMADLALVEKFRCRFEAEAGAINCRDLTGLDLTTQEGVEELMSSDIPQRVCFPAVNRAYTMALELLNETG